MSEPWVAGLGFTQIVWISYVGFYSRHFQFVRSPAVLDTPEEQVWKRDMCKQTVFLITYHFPPLNNGASIGLAKLVKFLPDLGWKVLVLTIDTRWIPRAQYAEEILSELPPEVCIVRVPVLRPTMKQSSSPCSTTTKWLFSFMRNCRSLGGWFLLPEDYGFLWIPYALPKALELARGANIDVIWTSSPPHNLHIVGLIVHKMSGIPWVVDLRDGWYGNPLFTPKLFVRQRFEYWLENLAMRNASHIITRVHSLKDDLYQRYGTETLISTVPNGFDPEDFDSEYVVRLGKSLRRQKFTLTHVGLLGGNRSPEVLFKAIYRLTQYRPNAFCDFQFVNVGGIEQKWLGFAAGLGIDALIVDIPNVPHREAIAYMLASDALWLIQVALDGGERAIPSKTYEYLAARKPIVASVCQGATRDLLEFTGGAFLVEPDDQESLLHILMTLYDHWRSEPDSLKHFQSNWNLVRQMTRQHSAERLVQIFNEISHP